MREIIATTDTRFICQLSKAERLYVYKAVKRKLIEADALSVEHLREALDSRVCDVLY